MDVRIFDQDGDGDGLFLLTSKKGNYLSLAPENITKYNGLIHYDAADDCFVKSLHDLRINAPLRKVVYNVVSAERHYEGGAVERFQLSSSALHYRLSGYTGPLFLDFDARRLDDYDTNGRGYEIQHSGDELRIRYRKQDAYEIAIVIKGVRDAERIERWEPRKLTYDARRGDGGDWWVYRACAIPVEGSVELIMTRSRTIDKAAQKAAYVAEHREEILEGLATRGKRLEGPIERTIAYASFDALVTKLKGRGTGIFAGLPWFNRYWSRDELIALAPLITTEQYTLVKEILLRYYELLENRGTLDAYYPKGGLIAADALGWLAIRTHELLSTLDMKGILNEYFTKMELAYLRDRLAAAVRRLLALRMHGGLIHNGPGETWMDAPVKGDDREGACVEINAQALRAMRCCHYLEQKTRLLPKGEWRLGEREMARAVRKAFFRDGRLWDMESDHTCRPNIFLAYYAYPDLLSREEWGLVFDDALARLLLPWGGLSSIEQGHPLYTEWYTGMRNTSYHRGDSWYWVNALAARVLQDFDAQRYHLQIEVITAACVHDLWQGALGHSSEVSSAALQEWGGCYSQSWSGAMLYELLSANLK